MTTARAAAYSYVEGASVWPATAVLGKVPAGLAQYLPGGGTKLFKAPLYQLGWQVTAAAKKTKGTQQSTPTRPIRSSARASTASGVGPKMPTS